MVGKGMNPPDRQTSRGWIDSRNFSAGNGSRRGLSAYLASSVMGPIVSAAIGFGTDSAVVTAVVPHAPDGPRSSPGPCTGELIGGRYRIADRIGRGGSATVYRGVDIRSHRPVAVKIFDSPATEPRTAQRRQAEVELLVRLDHPGLVSLLDAHIGSAVAAPDERSFLVMELVEGNSLEERLSDGGVLSPHTTADMGRQLAAALAVVHRSGVIHRDIKPGNILVDHTGFAKLADFGIARLLTADRLTITAEVVGTPRYLSPEQAGGQPVGPPTDIYSLGLVLLECLTGSPAFAGSAVECAMTRLARKPAVPTFLPPAWTNLLGNMTDLDPDQRPTAAAVGAVLTNLLPPDHHARTAVTVISTDYPDPPPHHPPSERSSCAPIRTLAYSAAVLTVAAVAAAILWSNPATRTTGHPGSESSPPAATVESSPPAGKPSTTAPATPTRAPGEVATDPRTAPPSDYDTQVRPQLLSNAPLPATTTTITVTTSASPPQPTPDPTPTTSTPTTIETSTTGSTPTPVPTSPDPTDTSGTTGTPDTTVSESPTSASASS